MTADPTNIFAVMMDETAKSMGINPVNIYTTCTPEIVKQLHKNTSDNIRNMCKKFIQGQIDERN